ncbi:DUF5681 domain-containing protein [Aliiglaciecola sp. LCG003]|uniref:DUF5681 domain-containing protein n=1 Tax=Aliiglaciecola sp. LCG003 TaxID=3053655 RepID=UPI0025729AC3|nr:DUF5681 domain-containing protein [Aliiglaciecola sp. LCG003]WJG10363.1 hypothetical protein QR722_04815 [Aliiglaciecola sp. LCG003]
MTTTKAEPDWKQNWKPDPDTPKTGNPNWRKGMSSPNPSGRPKGIVDKRHKVTQALLNDAHEIANVVVAKAKEGDLQAASLVLARVMPTLAAQSEKVQFDLDPSAPLAQQVEQVLAATADGEISPDNAKRIIEAIGALGAIRQMDEIEARLAALEAS